MRRAVEAVYAEHLFFNDTLKTLHERNALAEYFAASAAAVHACTVAVDEFARAEVGWYVRWHMMIRFKRFKPERDTHSIGMSHIVFDREGRIALHQDFWDAAGGLFEHVPVLGWSIGKIKQRL